MKKIKTLLIHYYSQWERVEPLKPPLTYVFDYKYGKYLKKIR